MNIEDLGRHYVIIDFSDLFTKSITNIYYKQGEVGTSSIKAKLVKRNTPLDLTGCRVILNIIDEKGEQVVDTATVLDEKNGIVEIIFQSVSLNTGISFFELTVVNAEYKTKKSPKLAYRVLDSLSEDAVIASEKYPILVNLIKDVDDLHTATNELSDKTKALNQEVRELNETMTQAESVRNTNETTRQENETARQESIANMQTTVNAKIAEVNTAKDNMVTKVDEKIAEVDEAKRSMITEVGNKITEMSTKHDELSQSIDDRFAEKSTEIDNQISGVKTELETARTDRKGTAHESLHERLLAEFENVDKLEETAISTVSTEGSNLSIEETTNGFLSSLKLEGKSLVNHSSIGKQTLNFGGSARNTPIATIKPNTKYTYFLNIVENTLVNNVGGSNVCAWNEATTQGLLSIGEISIKTNQVGLLKKVITTPTDLSTYSLASAFRTYNATISGTITIEEMILEGEHDYIPYFEGLASVGDGVENIEVKSIKSDGNLFDVTQIKDTEYGYAKVTRIDNEVTVKGKRNASVEAISLFKGTARVYLEKSKTYTFNFESDAPMGKVQGTDTVEMHWVLDADYNKAILSVPSKDKIITCTETGYYYPRLDVNKGDATHKFWNISVFKSETPKTYEPYKSDKKIVLYKDTDDAWKKPILRGVEGIKDLYDSDALKYYKRCGQIVLDGSENWQMGSGTMENTIYFLCQIPTLNRRAGNNNFTNDKLVSYEHSDLQTRLDVKGFSMNTHQEYANYVYVRLYKSELGTQDVAGFKKWLQANPITVVYQLAEEAVFECKPISLISYASETTYGIESGIVSPKSSMKVLQGVGNVVNHLKEQFITFQDTVFNMFKQVLSGDMQSLAYELYPSDFEEPIPTIDETVTEESVDE